MSDINRWTMRDDTDDGAVIGYEPKFTFERDGHIIKDQEALEQIESLLDYDTRSGTLKGFSDYNPSSVNTSLSQTQEYIRNAMDDLADAFMDGNWAKYANISSLLSAIKNDDTDYINNFVSYHENDPDGSVIPEIIKDLYELKNRVDLIKNTTDNIFFGDDYYKDSEKDDILRRNMDTLLSFERNTPAKINYPALAFDSLYCRAISLYSNSANKSALNHAEIIYDDTSVISSSSDKNIVKKLHNSVNSEITWRKKQFGIQHSYKNIEKSMYCFYNNRKEVASMYHLKQGAPGDAFILFQKTQDARDATDNALKNVIRNLMADTYHMSKLHDLRRQKKYLKEIYSNLSDK